MPTVEEALAAGGLTPLGLIKLTRKAAGDALRRHNAFLDDARFDDLCSYLLELGCKYAVKYDPEYGQSLSTWVYRIQRRRYIDWVRMTLGDNRHKTSTKHPRGGFVPLTEIDGPAWEDGYEEVEERLSAA